MPRDIDIVIERVRAFHPDATFEQLKVSHPGADDNGLWFFGIPNVRDDIQIESSTGMAPFLIESGWTHQEAIFEASIDQAVREVSVFLDALKKKTKEAIQSSPAQRP